MKLQGRAFRDLADSIASRQREIERDAERRARRNILAGLIDLRERLVRGRESAAAARVRIEQPREATLLQRLLAKPEPDPAAEEAVEALIKGYVLSAERLDQMLQEFGAQEIQCKGAPFDAHKMNAVDTEETDSARKGQFSRCTGAATNGKVKSISQLR